MTEMHTSRGPGFLLLRFARLVFAEPVVAAIVEPVIADLQHEVRAAGDSRSHRLRAHARGVWAFWMVMAVAPLAAHALPKGDRAASDPSTRGARLFCGLLVVLFASSWPLLGWMAVIIPACGLFLAVVLHRWYIRHPSGAVEAEISSRFRAAEINFASIPVGGNVAGLFVVVGTTLIVLTGVPRAGWFLTASVAAGAITAAARFMWRSGHPSATVPRNSIIRRA